MAFYVNTWQLQGKHDHTLWLEWTSSVSMPLPQNYCRARHTLTPIPVDTWVRLLCFSRLLTPLLGSRRGHRERHASAHVCQPERCRNCWRRRLQCASAANPTRDVCGPIVCLIVASLIAYSD